MKSPELLLIGTALLLCATVVTMAGTLWRSDTGALDSSFQEMLGGD